MIYWPLIKAFATKYWKLIAIAVAVIAAIIWFRGLINKAEQRGYDMHASEVAEALQKAENEAKEQRKKDADKNAQTAAEMEQIRSAFEELKNNPPEPKTLIKYREVKPDVQNNCPPVPSLDASFGVRFNQIYSLQSGTN